MQTIFASGLYKPLMQMKNKRKAKIKPGIKHISKDPILRRIQVQSKIIKKILAEIDQPVHPENEMNPDDEMHTVIPEYKENNEQ